MKYKRIIAYVLSVVMLVTLVTIIPVGNMVNVKAESHYSKKACWVSYQDIYNELYNIIEEKN